MIIRSYTRLLGRSMAGQLIKYINEGALTFKNELLFLLMCNTTGRTVQEVAAAFNRNIAHIKPGKRKRVAITQWILSFSPKERHLLTPSKLHALGREFIRLIEGSKTVVFGRVHMERNIHLHIAVTGNNLGCSKSRRLSKKQLKDLQIAMNRFQQRNFPELRHSLKYLPELKKSQEILPWVQMPLPFIESDGSLRAKRRGKTSELDTIRKELYDHAKDNPNKEAFIKSLENHSDLEVYYYRGKPTGIKLKSGKKFRFRRLACDLNHLQSYARNFQLDRIQDQTREKSQTITLER